MIYIVNDMFVSKNCPKYLQPLWEEIHKTLHYEFEDDTLLERFVNGCRSFFDTVTAEKKVKLTFHHKKDDNGGNISIIRHRAGIQYLISVSYFSLRGRLEVSRSEPMKVYPQNFIEEGGDV